MTLDLTRRSFLRVGGSALAPSPLNLRFESPALAARGAGKISRVLKPDQVVVYHGWEPFQFSGQPRKARKEVHP